jgi:hypothetical protein
MQKRPPIAQRPHIVNQNKCCSDYLDHQSE